MKKIFFAAFILMLFTGIRSIGQTVYASDKGEKYHTADCKLSGDAKDITLAAAKKAGKGPCGVCKPEDHFKDATTQCTRKTQDGKRCRRMTSNKKGKCFQHVS